MQSSMKQMTEGCLAEALKKETVKVNRVKQLPLSLIQLRPIDAFYICRFNLRDIRENVMALNKEKVEFNPTGSFRIQLTILVVLL